MSVAPFKPPTERELRLRAKITKTKVAARRDLQAKAVEGARGRFWYDDAQQHIARKAREEGLDPTYLTAAIGAYGASRQFRSDVWGRGAGPATNVQRALQAARTQRRQSPLAKVETQKGLALRVAGARRQVDTQKAKVAALRKRAKKDPTLVRAAEKSSRQLALHQTRLKGLERAQKGLLASVPQAYTPPVGSAGGYTRATLEDEQEVYVPDSKSLGRILGVERCPSPRQNQKCARWEGGVRSLPRTRGSWAFKPTEPGASNMRAYEEFARSMLPGQALKQAFPDFDFVKTHAYVANVAGESNPVTVDRHIAKIAGLLPDKKGAYQPGKSAYRYIASDVRAVAKRLGWTPARTMAAIWTAQRSGGDGAFAF